MHDVLCTQVSLILLRKIYATAAIAAIAGAAVFVVLTNLGATAGHLVALPTVAAVFGLRLTALRLDLPVPSPRPKGEGPPSADEGS